jgi:ribA/ribD-fused uncharacterized protein
VSNNEPACRAEDENQYEFMSNFYNAPVIYEGLTYRNNEAAFQAQKLANKEERKRFCAYSPSKAKLEGRNCNLRPDWEDVKYQVMYDVVKAKFSQNVELKKQLLATGMEELIEGNWWHDNCWGDCSCERCKDIKGQNNLGKILMKVREELRNEN